MDTTRGSSWRPAIFSRLLEATDPPYRFLWVTGANPVATATVPVGQVHQFSLGAANINPRATSMNGQAYRVVSNVPLTAYQFQPLDNVNQVFSWRRRYRDVAEQETAPVSPSVPDLVPVTITPTPGAWYLSIIGVLPKYQGQGLGPGLVTPVLARSAWR